MKTRRLGKNGPMVSSIGLGCMSFAGFYGKTDEAESHEALACARDHGVTFLDTANIYGLGVSEKVIGSFIKGNPGDFVIATKAGIRFDPVTKKRSFNNSADYLRDELEGSLKKLGVDHVPLYYIHRRDQSIPIEDVVGTLVRFKEEGKIGGIGFSEISPSSLRRAHAVHPIMAVQNEYSLWTRLPELGMIQACKELDVAFVPFSPLARGMFSNSIPDPKSLSDKDFRINNPRFIEPNYGYNLEAIKPFYQLASEMGTTPSALALAWVLEKGDHLIPIPGTRSKSHLLDDIAGAELELSADDMAEIERVLPIGFAHGDRYTDAQSIGPERYS